MVGVRLVFFLLLSASSLLVGASSPTCGTDTEPCIRPLRLPRLKSITVERTGTREPQAGDLEVGCRSFALTPTRVRNYLQLAGRITANDRHYLLPNSPCSAQGNLKTIDGRSATWKIGILGEGELHWRDGKSIDLYCNACSTPFVK